MPADDVCNTPAYRTDQVWSPRERVVSVLAAALTGLVCVWLAVWMLMD